MASGLGGGNRWGGGGKTTPTTAKGSGLGAASSSTASSGGGSGLGSGNRWGGSGGSAAAVSSGPKKPGLLGQFKNIVTSVPSGLVGLAHDAATQVKNEWQFQGNAAPLAFTVPGGQLVKHIISPPTPRPGETKDQMNERLFPFAQKSVESLKRTGGDVVHPTHFARASQQGTIVSKLLEDAANASLVLGPLSKGAGAIADRTAAAAAAEGAGGATARETAARVAAQVLHGAARGTEAVAGAPAKPYLLATTGVEAGPLLSRIPGVAAGEKVGLLPALASGANRLAEGEGRIGQVARLAKVDPQSRLLRREALTPAMETQSEAVGRQVRLGQQVAKTVQTPAEEAAMFPIGEAQAKALATYRDSFGNERFDAFVKRTFGDTLTPEAAHLAADAVSGKAPEAAARIDQALSVGRMGEGGRLQRSEQYLANKPGREWQTKFAPDQRVIDSAIEKPMTQIPKAEKLARTLRQRADQAQAALDQAKADASARLDERSQQAGAQKLGQQRATLERAASRAEARAVAAADRLTSLQDLVEAAKVRPADVPLASLQKAAGRVVAANERAAVGLDKGLASTLDRKAAAEAASANLGDVAAKVGQPQAQQVGAATERVRQGGRLARLESRNLNAIRTKLERLPAEAEPAAVAPTFGAGKTLGRLEAKASQGASLANRSEAVLGRLRERVRTTAEKAAGSIEAAPARLRPALAVNRSVTAELADHAKGLRDQGLADAADKVDQAASEIPTTLKALQAAGVDPDHFIHVQPADKPTVAGARSGSLPKITKGREEKFRSDSLHFERTVRAQTQGEIDAAKQVIARQTFDKIGSMPFAARLGQGPLANATTMEEAVAAGYEPWNPKMLFEKGKVSKAEQARLAAGEEGTTVFVPKHIFDGFRSYFNSNTVDQMLRKTYDPLIQGIKVGQLALSPSWQVNNIIGNAMMATFGAGVDPATLAMSIKDAIKAYRASGPKGERTFEGAVAPRRLLTAGPTHAEFRFLRGPEDEALSRFPRAQAVVQKATAPLRAVANKAYAANEFIDNVGRSAVYIAKKGQGLSDEQAIKAALQAMGDFSRMTPVESQVVKRLIPYYAWSRHITQLAFRLPIEHPLRVAWTLSLANQYADPTTRDMPGSLAGAVRLPGNKLLEPGRLFPFGDAGRVLEPNGIESQLSPVIKIPVQARQGVNLASGKPFTRPPGTGRFDEFGNPLPTAPSLAHQVGGLFPQKRLLDAVTNRDKVARYDTGEKVVTKTGPIPTGKTGGLGALRFLGLPVSDAKQAQDMAKRVAEKQAANAKARANYKKRAATS